METQKKVWYKSKTIWVSAITIVLGFLVNSGVVNASEINEGTVGIVLGVLFGAIRLITGSSITFSDLPTTYDSPKR